jgi:hypothetical protein
MIYAGADKCVWDKVGEAEGSEMDAGEIGDVNLEVGSGFGIVSVHEEASEVVAVGLEILY